MQIKHVHIHMWMMDFAKEIEDLRKELAETRGQISSLCHDIVTIRMELETIMTKTETSDNQLAVITQDNILAVMPEFQSRVYEQVVAEINSTIVPVLDKTLKWIGYNLQDGHEVADNYRREFEKQACPTLTITDGHVDKRVISPHVRTFFEPDTDSD